jgi:beta-fructofuranosidase
MRKYSPIVLLALSIAGANAYTVNTSRVSVENLSADAIRTDGYSTWITDTIPADAKFIKCRFALESFPTDTAGLISLMTPLQGVAISVDRYGSLMIAHKLRGEVTYQSLPVKAQRFKWISIGVDLKKQRVMIDDNCFKLPALPKAPLKVYYGKDIKPRDMWGQDLALINGIIADVEVSDKRCSDAEWQAYYKEKADDVPSLAIPKERFDNDLSRPKYHLLPAANWTNETHGLIRYNGKYHIFNQKNASNILLRNINWGHFTSTDLLHWYEEKPALSPQQEPGFDAEGIWSGCAILDDNGAPHIFYTGGNTVDNAVGHAIPLDDDLLEWSRSDTPAISGRPPQFSRTDMRDQWVWREKDAWHMIIGFGIDEGTRRGALLHYTSTDLNNWTYQNLLYEGNPDIDHTGVFWEMPVMLPLDGKYILQVNRVPDKGTPARSQYWIGDFVDNKFVPDDPVPQNLEVINRLLSPSVWKENDSTAVAMAIIPDEIGGRRTLDRGWAHLYSIPRVWRLSKGKICQSPHPVLKSLRRDSLNFDRVGVVSHHGAQKELLVNFTPNHASNFGVKLCKAPDDAEYTLIYFDVNAGELVVDQTYSSLDPHAGNRVKRDKYTLDPTKSVSLRLFIDSSVVEGFINDEDAFTTRIFPTLPESQQIEVYADDPSALVSGTIWTLNDAIVTTNF